MENLLSLCGPLRMHLELMVTADTSGTHGTTTKSSDLIIPESSVTSLYIPSPHEEVDEGCDKLPPSHMTHKSHVPSGQRHALLTWRNTTFEPATPPSM
jgi:hypothetical protein